ncbi:MAG: nuclease family protein [Bacteroidetes bacterium]|nr:nuclease family protein [Bacteroidota bacterium]
MQRGGSTYIMTNKRHSVLYTGMTADLRGRVWDHKTKRNPKCFTAKYNCDKLVYYINFHHIEEAISEENRIKQLSRAKKLALITGFNPLWNDLYDTLD